MTVEENYDYRGDGKQVAIPGLRIGENRVHDVQMVQDGDQQATARCVEQRRHDDSNSHEPEEEGSERPGALRRTAHQEGRRMPEGPYYSEN